MFLLMRFHENTVRTISIFSQSLYVLYDLRGKINHDSLRMTFPENI